MVTSFFVSIAVVAVIAERNARKTNPQKALRGQGVKWQVVRS